MQRLEAEDWDYDALPGVGAPFRLIRLRRKKGLLLVIATGLGILVAVALICSTPLYTAIVQDAQLQQALSQAGVQDINVSSQISVRPSSVEAVTSIRDKALALSRKDTASFAPSSDWYMELEQPQSPANARGPAPANAPIALPGSSTNPPEIAAFALDYTQALPHMQVIAGRLPQDTAPSQPAEVMVTPKLGLAPGDTFTLVEAHRTVRVCGVWFPKDLNDRYWNGYNYDTIAIDNAPQVIPLHFPALFTESGFFSTFYARDPADPTSLLPGPQLAMNVVSYTDPHRVTAANMSNVSRRIGSYAKDLQTNLPTGAQGVTDLAFGGGPAKLITGVQKQFSALDLPLSIIVAQGAGLALLFVIAMAALMVGEHAATLATLKSRGASLLQVQLSFGLQGLVMAAAGALLGPLLAMGLSEVAARRFVPGAGGILIQPSSAYAPQVVRLAVVGAGIALLAVLAATWQASRSDVLAYRISRGRARAVPLWRRYHLDLLVAAVCCAGYVDLSFFGGLEVRTQLAGATHADPVLLATPALLLLAGALVALRLFPLVGRLGARAATRARGLAALLGFAQISRASDHLMRLTLLLTLAVALNVFTLAFHASLGQNATRQATFIAGADERIIMPQSFAEQTFNLQRAYQGLPGVTLASPVFRSEAQLDSNDAATSASLLAVDDQTFAQVAYWLPEDAGARPAALMAEMRAHPAGPQGGTVGHPLWAIVDPSFLQATALRVGDDFALAPQESSYKLQFVVGAVARRIPTMTDSATIGNVVVDVHEYLRALFNPSIGAVDTVSGPNEMWLRESADPDSARRRDSLLVSGNLLPAGSLVNRRTLEDQIRRDPLTAGVSGLLELSGWLAAALAIAGVVTHAGLAARQRRTQFTLVRTLGASAGELAKSLLAEQSIVYAFGLLGGAALGALLSTATLPILRYAGELGPAAGLNLPAYQVAFPLPALALSFFVLICGCALGLAVSVVAAQRAGSEQLLRIGED